MRLPGVSLPIAASFLLFQLQHPVMPLCWNALQEARALRWVPPEASATAAFLHLYSRLPQDANALQSIYSCLCGQNVFRVTRQAVVGEGEQRDSAAFALRERRASLTIHLSVATPAKADVERVAGVDAGSLIVVPTPGFSCRAPPLPLSDVITEYYSWHQLYPEAGCTPALVVLHAQDPGAARCVAQAVQCGNLPYQHLVKEFEAGIRYIAEVRPLITTHIFACASAILV